MELRWASCCLCNGSSSWYREYAEWLSFVLILPLLYQSKCISLWAFSGFTYLPYISHMYPICTCCSYKSQMKIDIVYSYIFVYIDDWMRVKANRSVKCVQTTNSIKKKNRFCVCVCYIKKPKRLNDRYKEKYIIGEPFRLKTLKYPFRCHMP